MTVELSSNGFLVYAGDTRHEDKPDAWKLLQIIYKTICPKWVDNIHKTDIIGNNDTENCQKLGRWFMETRLLDKAPLHLEELPVSARCGQGRYHPPQIPAKGQPHRTFRNGRDKGYRKASPGEESAEGSKKSVAAGR